MALDAATLALTAGEHKAVHNMYERAVRKQAAPQEELAASGRVRSCGSRGAARPTSTWPRRE